MTEPVDLTAALACFEEPWFEPTLPPLARSLDDPAVVMDQGALVVMGAR